MKQIGGTLFFFGIGSIILYFLGMQFVLLMWLDMMGETAAWATRIGMSVVGGILWVLGKPSEE